MALAQDLRQEFYPFYPDLLKKILIILNIRDPDKVEWAFTCLAYLFKHLWKFLVKDLSTVFDQLLPLLSSSKPHYVNNFAAESFAFVARKVRDKKSFLKLILKTLKKTNDVSIFLLQYFEVFHVYEEAQSLTKCRCNLLW